MSDSNGTVSRAELRMTARELEVLALVAKGCSTPEIARLLWITEDTVQTHVKRTLRRLGARTRAHAVAIAYSEGLWQSSNDGDAGGDDV